MQQPSNVPTEHIRFGAFELDLRAGELYRNGAKLRLQEQPFQILRLLLEKPGEVVTREELREKIWPADTFVDFDHSLYTAITKLREALRDSSEHPRFIETLPRRGYRFIADVDGFAAPTSPDGPPGVTGDSFARRAISQLVEGEAEARRSRTRRRMWPVMSAIVALVLAAVALGLNVRGWRDRLLGQAAQPQIRSIAVLPLESLSSDPEQGYFAEGMTDELITNLAQISALRVISRSSVIQYKAKHASTRQIARELNVDALVEGTVSRSGNRVRITAQLIDARTDRHLWAETYERDLRDVLALQDELAQAIANQIEIKLTPGEQVRLATHRPVNPAAHEAYLRGLYELHGIAAETDEDLQLQSIQRAIADFQQALAHDPDDALAYAGLADAYRSLSTDFRAPLDVLVKAKAAALKAIELDDSIAEAHAALGSLEYSFDWDWPRAEREFRRALELNPNLPQAHADYAEYLLKVSGRTDEAIQELQRAYALDPLLPFSAGKLAGFLFMERRYPQSIEEARKLGNGPGNDARDVVLALSYAELGQRDQAIAAADRALASWRNPVALSQIAAAYALAGKKNKARAMLRRIEAQASKRYICGYNLACVYSLLGDKEQAFAWLERAFGDRSDCLPSVAVDPRLDPLRNDPRFGDLLRRVGLPLSAHVR